LAIFDAHNGAAEVSAGHETSNEGLFRPLGSRQSQTPRPEVFYDLREWPAGTRPLNQDDVALPSGRLFKLF
jgi:hypothetical protein